MVYNQEPRIVFTDFYRITKFWKVLCHKVFDPRQWDGIGREQCGITEGEGFGRRKEVER